MDWSKTLLVIWSAMNSPLGITFVAGIVLWLLNRLYSAKPKWRLFEGTIVAAIKWAEKEIPDGTKNKSMQRLDAALRYTIDIYEKTQKKPASEKVKTAMREGIQITQVHLESAGVLPGRESKK